MRFIFVKTRVFLSSVSFVKRFIKLLLLLFRYIGIRSLANNRNKKIHPCSGQSFYCINRNF